MSGILWNFQVALRRYIVSLWVVISTESQLLHDRTKYSTIKYSQYISNIYLYK
jgi:hypothetical protein